MALFGVLLLGAALRFTGLADQSYWGDEVFTVNVLGGGGLSDLPHRVGLTEAAPALYYLAAWFWAGAFGDGEAPLRAFSALLGTATIPVVYLGVRELAGRRAALIAAALCACSPLLIWYSQEARVYGLYMLLSAGSFWLFARSLRDSRPSVLAAWAVVSALAIATFYFAAILVLIEAAVLLAIGPFRRLQVALATLLPLATIAALLPSALDHRHRQHWIPDIPFGPRIPQTGEQFLVGNGDPATAVVLLSAAIVLGAGVALALRGDPADRRAAAIAAGIGLLGLGVIAGAKAVGSDYFVARNALYAWFPLAAAAAIALGSPRLGAGGPVAAAVLCATGIWLALEVKREPELQRVDYRGAARLLESSPAPAGRSILAPGNFLSTALPQYLPGTVGPLDAPQPSTELDVLEVERGDGRRDCWWGTICGLPRGSADPAAPPGYVLVGRSSAGLFTLSRYRAARPRAPTGGIEPDSAWYFQQPAVRFAGG